MKKLIKLFLFSLVSLTQIGYAQPPTQPTIPIVTAEKANLVVTPQQNTFTIKLKSNPTTGYLWFLQDYDKNLIMPIAHQYQRPISQLVGASGYELWTFKVKPDGFIVPQVTYIRLVYERPWETDLQNNVTQFKISTLKNTSM